MLEVKRRLNVLRNKKINLKRIRICLSYKT